MNVCGLLPCPVVDSRLCLHDLAVGPCRIDEVLGFGGGCSFFGGFADPSAFGVESVGDDLVVGLIVDSGQPVGAVPGVGNRPLWGLFLGQVAVGVVLVADGLAANGFALELVVVVVEIGRGLAVLGFLSAVADFVVLVVGGFGGYSFLDFLLGQFAGGVVLVVDGSGLAVDGFLSFGLSAVFVQGVGEFGEGATVLLLVDELCELVGRVVGICTDDAVGAGDLAAVASFVVFKGGFRGVRRDDLGNAV